MIPLWLIGGGGHCKSCIEAIESQGLYQVQGIVDQPSRVGKSVLGYPIVGTDEDLDALLKDSPLALITVGHIKTPEPRMRLSKILKEKGATFPVVVASSAYVSKHAHLSEGTVVLHGAIVNAGARIGEHCILNSMSLVEHDASLGHHVHLSTGAIINGGTSVGPATFIGSRSTTREYIQIGHGNTIRAGSVVMKSLPDIGFSS